MKDILLFPAGGNSAEAIGVIEDINRRDPTWNILGLLDDNPELKSSSVARYKILGCSADLASYRDTKILCVPGNPTQFRGRLELIKKCELSDEQWVQIVHPSATVGPQVQLGFNILVMAGVRFCFGNEINDHTIFLPNSVISHHSQIGEGTMVGSNVSISGHVNIGKNCYIGSGAKIKENVSIGDKAMIGLGAVVVTDIPAGAVAYGNPAKIRAEGK